MDQPEQLTPASETPQPKPVETGGVEQQPSKPEQKTPGYEREAQAGNQAAQSQPMTLPPVVPPQQAATPPTPVPVTDDDTSDQAQAPLIADDVDVIEKEWVDKARAIVDETRDDPHQQEKRVEKLKVNYLEQRYGKKIKSSSS